jgi:hypothetical protein
LVFKVQVSTIGNITSLCTEDASLNNFKPFALYGARYDIPVLHINDMYWTKHRLAVEDAIAGLQEARSGSFEARSGEPDAERLEHS